MMSGDVLINMVLDGNGVVTDEITRPEKRRRPFKEYG